MSSAKSVEIPIEIFELIIDNVADWELEEPDEDEDDKSDISIQDYRDMALKSCALVCRAFLPLCRKHLFKRMSIHDRHDCIMKKLTALLRMSPEILNYVRDLVLYVRLYDFQLPPIDLTIFSRLKSFRLIFSPEPGDFTAYLDFNKMEPQMKNILLYPRPTLETLGLVHIANFPFYDLPLLYPDLRQLVISSVKVDEILIPMRASPLPPIKLDALFSTTAHNTQTDAIQKLLQMQQSDRHPLIDISDLKSLFFSYNSDSTWATTRRILLGIVGLRTLTISTVREFHLDGLGQLLLPLNSLKNINIYTDFVHSDSDPLFGLCEELETLGTQPNVLEELKIVVVPNDFERSAGPEWGKLDQVIDKFAWPRLKKVELVVELHMIEPSKTDLRRRLRALPEIHLPKLAAESRKSLNFRFKAQA